MKSLKKLFWILSLAGFLFTPAAFSCGWNEPEYFYYSKSFDILYGELINQPFDRRISYFPGSYFSDESDEMQAVENYNLQAWSHYLKVSKEDAKAIVYARTADKLASQPEAVKTYLSIVARQEPIANQSDLRWLSKEEQQKQKAENDRLGQAIIGEIKTQLATEQDPFLRQRYAYLLVRLLHYTGHYQKAIDAYVQYKADIRRPDKEIAAWIGLLYAGALQHVGKRAESAYQFATLLPQTDTKKLEAQLNFSIKTDKEWDELMALCKNDDEKALMHFVRALRVNSNSLEELKSVYALAPDSEWVDALLFRELAYVQFPDRMPDNEAMPWLQASRDINADVLIDDLDEYTSAKTEQAKQKLLDRRSQYLEKLSQIVGQIRQDKKRKDMFMADYAALYLKLLAGQSVDVAAVKDVEAGYPNDPRLPYVKPLEMLIYLENLQAIDTAAENTVSDDLAAIETLEKPVSPDDRDNEYTSPYKRRTQDIITYTYAKLAPLYAAAKQAGKAYMAKKHGDIDLDGIHVGEIRDLQALQTKASPNRLEQQMVADFNKAFGAVDYETNKFVVENDENELIARKYLAAGMLDKAKAAAEEAKHKIFKTTYNPFTTGRNGNNRIRSKSMTLLEVIDMLQKLEAEVAKKPGDAQSQFLLGTAYYNMTWFGNDPNLLRTRRSTLTWKNGVTDFSQARQHYELVLKHTTDRELKAKALYALAKIEENTFYMEQDKQGTDIGKYWPHSNKGYAEAVEFAKQNGLGTYFREIRNGYEDTQYFKDVIRQCADYKYYFAQ